MGINQSKKDETIKDQNTSSASRDHNSSTTQDHNLTEKCNQLTETGFKRWIITNFSELKEHVLIQYKEAKNHDKTLQESLTRITCLERNINVVMELKNTTQELHNATISINSQHTKQKKEFQSTKTILLK